MKLMNDKIARFIVIWSLFGALSSGAQANTSRSMNGEKIFLLHGIVDRESVAVENDYVTVLRNSTLNNKIGFGTRVVVALTSMSVNSSKGTVRLARGGVAVFLEGETYQAAGGEYFEVNFKKEHPPLTRPEQWIEPEKNTMVYEDGQIRIFEERLPPGGERALHSHAQRVVVRLNEVQLTDPRTHPNGTPGGGIQVPNTVRFAEPMVHVVRNLSTIPLFNIVIEFKLPKQ
jgi:hypothetical protein